MLFIDTTARPRNWLHLGMASFPFSQAPFSARFGFYVHSQRIAEWPGGQSASETPRGQGKSGLAFMVVILQVKGTLLYISQCLIGCQPRMKTWESWPLDCFEPQVKYIYTYYWVEIFWVRLRQVVGWNRFLLGTRDRPWNVNLGSLCVWGWWIGERVSSYFGAV